MFRINVCVCVCVCVYVIKLEKGQTSVRPGDYALTGLRLVYHGHSRYTTASEAGFDSIFGTRTLELLGFGILSRSLLRGVRGSSLVLVFV